MVAEELPINDGVFCGSCACRLHFLEESIKAGVDGNLLRKD